MQPVKNKAYKAFDWVLAAVSLLLVMAFLLFSATRLLAPNQLGISIYTASLSSLHLIYMFGFYSSLRRRSLVGASLVGATLLILNVCILVIGTGSFNSPYYALWLMLILAIGIYRPAVPLAFLMLTTLYFFGLAYTQTLPQANFTSAVIALIATYISGGMGFWLWHTHHTRLRRAEDVNELQSQLSQEQLKSEILIHHIGEGVMVINRQGQVQLLNPAGEALTGWQEAEAKGIDGRLVLPLLDEQEQPVAEASSPIAQVFTESRSISSEDLTLKTRSGKKFDLWLMASPIIGKASRVDGAVMVFRDITQSKAAERQRNEFISTASHEMRTPVAAVEGYIALALNPKVAKLDPKAQGYLLKAQASIQHLGKLFQDLLSTTRIEEGKLPNHPEVVEFSKLVLQVIDEMKFKAQSQGLKLALKAAGTGGKEKGITNIQPLYYVYVDPERIREVLINLIDNGLKFTPAGEVNITLDGDDAKVVVGVEDSGIGIAPEDMPHLFQKFYRIDNSNTRDIGGTGLGLYICRAIIEMYQGRIWVESQLGAGSHFKFSLPRLSFAKAEVLLDKADRQKAAIKASLNAKANAQDQGLKAGELIAPTGRPAAASQQSLPQPGASG